MRNPAAAPHNSNATTRRRWLSAAGVQTAGLGALHQFWGDIARAGSQPNSGPPPASHNSRANL